MSGVEWRRLVAGVAVLALAVGLIDCSPGASPASSESPLPSQPAVIPLPTHLPDTLTFEQTLPLFEYDRRVPFDVGQVSSYPRSTADLADITYMGANGVVMPAYLVTPVGQGPYAGVIWMGWTGDYSQIRKEFVEEAMAMAEHGVVSLLVSGYFPWYVSPSNKDADRMALIGQIRELRRSIDFLLAQPGVDPARVAFVGHSMSAMYGADLAAVDRRLKAAVLMGPHETMTDWIFEGYGLEASTETEYRTAMASFDPIAFVGRASPTALFFQFGSDDQFVPRDVALNLYSAASAPKKIGWYAGGHDLDDGARADRTAWLTTQLNLTS